MRFDHLWRLAQSVVDYVLGWRSSFHARWVIHAVVVSVIALVSLSLLSCALLRVRDASNRELMKKQFLDLQYAPGVFGDGRSESERQR
jgi:uncharacterized membrane protein